ncbi:MAG: DUF2783 domain-containing protein [Burkholderiales bacterium]|nr:DUF2783 domain-containing protein [Burkholderiales bacterium]
MPLSFNELEIVYDELAVAIDEAGPQRESVFLAKLALSLAQELGDAARVSALIRDCLNEPADQLPAGQRLV